MRTGHFFFSLSLSHNRISEYGGPGRGVGPQRLEDQTRHDASRGADLVLFFSKMKKEFLGEHNDRLLELRGALRLAAQREGEGEEREALWLAGSWATAFSALPFFPRLIWHPN